MWRGPSCSFYYVWLFCNCKTKLDILHFYLFIYSPPQKNIVRNNLSKIKESRLRSIWEGKKSLEVLRRKKPWAQVVEMAQQVRTLTGKTIDLNLIPGPTQWKESTNSHKMSSDLSTFLPLPNHTVTVPCWNKHSFFFQCSPLKKIFLTQGRLYKQNHMNIQTHWTVSWRKHSLSLPNTSQGRL